MSIPETSPEMSLPEKLKFITDFSDGYNWGVLTSCGSDNNGQDIAIPSFIFFARLNNFMLFVVPPNFRQYQNVQAGKVFSFLVSNTELFESAPQQCARVLILGNISLCKEVKRDDYLAICRQKVPNNPVLNTNPYVLVLIPKFLQYAERSSVAEGYKTVSIDVEFPEGSLDDDGNYIVTE